MERQGDRHVGALDQTMQVGQEAIDQPGEARGGVVEGGADGIGRHLLQELGFHGGEHDRGWAEAGPGCSLQPPRLGGGASAQQPCLSAMPNLTPS